jgi:hypothetical protein
VCERETQTTPRAEGEDAECGETEETCGALTTRSRTVRRLTGRRSWKKGQTKTETADGRKQTRILWVTKGGSDVGDWEEEDEQDSHEGDDVRGKEEQSEGGDEEGAGVQEDREEDKRELLHSSKGLERLLRLVLRCSGRVSSSQWECSQRFSRKCGAD